MESINDLTNEFIEYCDKIGIDIVGFSEAIKLDKFINKFKPDSYLSNSKTVIVIGFHLYDIILDAWSKNEDNERSFHFADLILLDQCHRIKNFLTKKGFKSKIIPYEPGLYLKDAAALAGIGPIGKNNLLITKQFGSQVRLRSLITEAELTFGTPVLESVYCSNCNICIDSCPAGALEGGKYNKHLCRSYCLENLKNLSENTVIWCNICIESCPIGRNKK